MELNHAIANHVAIAKRNYNDAQAKQKIAQDELNSLRARMGSLTSEQSEIIQDRAAGNVTKKQEDRLVVLDADIRGLTPLIEEAAKKVESLNCSHLLKNVQNAEAQWTRHQQDVALYNLNDRSKEIEALLIKNVQTILDLGRKTGRGQRLSTYWKPSNALERLIKLNVLEGRPGT